MTAKENAYAHLVEAIKDCDDEALLRKRPDQWQRVRRIDKWLVAHRENEAIPDTVYEKGCQTIIDYYLTEKPTWPPKPFPNSSSTPIPPT